MQEEAVSEIFRSHNFYYPVEISIEESPPLSNFPWIRPSNFLKAMSKMNDLSHLLGGHSLQEARGMLLSFWAKYRALFPQHQLWAEVESHRKTLDRCLPIFLHGDEGVTYKKGGVLVLSMQGAFGHGSRASERAKRLEENYRALSDGIPLNFLRTGFQTRLLICVCPKDSTQGFNIFMFYVFLMVSGGCREERNLCFLAAL